MSSVAWLRFWHPFTLSVDKQGKKSYDCATLPARYKTHMTSATTTRAALDLIAFAGEWINTNEGPREIDKVSLRSAEGRMYLRVWGNAHPAGADWGEIEIENFYAVDESSSQGMSFVARYDFTSLGVEIGVNLNKGLLVMAMFNSWNTSGPTNYFAREFFRR
jgi:hypothetical protein